MIFVTALRIAGERRHGAPLAAPAGCYVVGVKPAAKLISVVGGGTKGPRDRPACKGC
jgi:hypothetical protein